MTDDLPFDYPDVPPANPAAVAKKCRRHEWWMPPVVGPDAAKWHFGANGPVCRRCGRLRDEEKAKRGRSSRRLGGDQERRIERVYGPTKIGERGDPVDHLGRLFKWQSKASRRAAPAWLKGPIDRMAGLYGERVPVLILSFVRPGVKPDDYIVIRGSDWLDVLGRDTVEDLP